jgi:hypothetical protein
MAVYQNPVGLSAAPVANQLSVMLTFKERLCEPFCVLNNNQPSATVTYVVGTPTLNNSTVFVPITARVEILVPSGNKCCGKAQPLVYTENFKVAFQGRTTLPTSTPVITSVGTDQGIACVKNGKAYGYVINDSVTISIGAASSAS